MPFLTFKFQIARVLLHLFLVLFWGKLVSFFFFAKAKEICQREQEILENTVRTTIWPEEA